MRVESPIKQTLFRWRYSYHYGEREKVAKPSVLKGFQLVINYLMYNLGLIYFLMVNVAATSQTKTFHNLSKYEKRWAIAHPFAALKIKKHQAEMYAVYKEVKQQHLLDTFENGGKLDAFRHTFAMAFFSKYVGAKKMRKLGIAHEKANHWQYLHRLPDKDGELPDSLSSVMDLKNNNIGLFLAKEWRNLSVQELKQKIILVVKDGSAFVIKRNAQAQYLDCDDKIIPAEKLRLWNSPKCLVPSN